MFCHKNSNSFSFCCQKLPVETLTANDFISESIKFNEEVKSSNAKKLLKEMHIEETIAKILSSNLTLTTTLKPIQISERIGTKKIYADNEFKNNNKAINNELETLKNFSDNNISGKTNITNNKNLNKKAKAQAQAVRTLSENSKRTTLKTTSAATQSAEDESIIYQPHSQGGYAVSKNLLKINSRKNSEQKLIAQQFLLQQIKEGWPYDEKFYRSDSKSYIYFKKITSKFFF